MSTETATAPKKNTKGIGDTQRIADMLALGWEATQTNGLWFAKKEGEKDIGPAQNSQRLLMQVELKSGPPVEKGNGKAENGAAKSNGKTVTVGKSTLNKGEFLFDEMKPTPQKEIPGLKLLILDYEAHKERRIEELAQEVALKKEIDTLMHANQDSLAFDPSRDGFGPR